MGIGGFRKSSKKGYLPNPKEISALGLINEYFFQFPTSETEKLLDAACSLGILKDPTTEMLEQYLAINLISREDGKNRRTPLNLVICLDVSGSMKYTIDYDWSDDIEKEKTKMQLAVDAITTILKKLEPGERVGIVLFDHNVYKFQEIKKVEDFDMEGLLKRVQEIKERGGTNILGGLKISFDMLRTLKKEDEESRKNQSRIIFITDGKPTIGGDEDSIYELTVNAAKNDEIYVSYIGMGIDFNENLVDRIAAIRGANYFSLHTKEDFVNALDTEFNYNVTPIIFNVDVKFESNAYDVETYYGTPSDDDIKSGESLMTLDTILASPKDERGVKGGVVLLKLKPKTIDHNDMKEKNVKVIFKYQDLKGTSYEEVREISIGENENLPFYQNIGVRKSILLCKFNDFIRYVIRSAGKSEKGEKMVKSSYKGSTFEISQSVKKKMSIFAESYFAKEMKIIGDEKLAQEYEILQEFIKAKVLKSKKEEEVTKEDIKNRLISGKKDPTKFMFNEIVPDNKKWGNVTKKDILEGCFYCDGKCNEKIPSNLEIVFSFDVTGSMAKFIKEVRRKLKEVVKSLLQDIPDIRIGLIAHSDYCDHKRYYVLKKLDLTNHLPTLLKFIEVCDDGGGDEQCIAEVRNLNWSPKSRSKSLVVIGDADPHKKNEYYGIDWRTEGKKLKERGIKCYGVQCGDSCKSGFYQKISDITGGSKLILKDIDDIIEIFVGICHRESVYTQYQVRKEEIKNNFAKIKKDEKYVIELEKIGGIDFLSKDQLIEIHNAIQNKAVRDIKILGGCFDIAIGKAGCRYLRINDIMFIQQDKDSLEKNKKITWITISGEFGYIIEK